MYPTDCEKRQRPEILADYLLSNRATIRQTAREFSVSKSTVHKDLSEKLPRINRTRYEEVKALLDTNKAERHLRGGEATRRKYQMNKQKKASE